MLPGSHQLELPAALQAKLDEAAALSGSAPAELIGAAIETYLEEPAAIRRMLDSRYDDIQSGRVQPVDGKALFEELRRRDQPPAIALS